MRLYFLTIYIAAYGFVFVASHGYAQQGPQSGKPLSKFTFNKALIDDGDREWYSIGSRVLHDYKMVGPLPYFNYENALAASRKLKKPVMVYFTRTDNSNSLKLERNLWADPDVEKCLKEDFLLVVLYCDLSAITLPPGQQYFSKKLKKQVVTMGEKNHDLEETIFSSQEQPICFFVDENGNKIVKGGCTNSLGAAKFRNRLAKVKAKYKKWN